MDNKLKPALIGGVVIGILSVIPLVSTCCCLWAILGGLLASFLYVKDSPTPATPGDGAIVGALAGLVGAIISFVIGIPLALLLGGMMVGMMSGMLEGMDPSQAEIMRQRMLASQTVGGAIFNGFIVAVLLLIFSTLGGLVGVPLFEKRKGGPPPPPAAGGGPGSYPG